MKFKTEFLLPALLLFTSNCPALDWLVTPSMTLSQRYTDNLRMLYVPHSDNFITTISPGLVLGYIEDDNDLKLNLNWNQLEYLGDSSLDFSEKIASLNHTFRRDRWSTGITARYGEESSFGTQLGENGSGILTVQVPRYSTTISPQISYQFTEKNSLQLSGSYLDVSFGPHPNTGGLSFANYNNESVNATATHKYLPNLSFNFTTSYSLYNANNTIPGTTSLPIQNCPGQLPTNGVFPAACYQSTTYQTVYSQTSTTLSYTLGFNYSFDEQTLIAASGGIRNSDTNSGNNVTVDCVKTSVDCGNSNSPYLSTTSGKIYSASITRSFESGNVNLSYNQQLSPASTGSQQQTTQYGASFAYEFTERWSAGLNASYMLSQYVAGYGSSPSSYANNNRTITTISPNIKWLWTPEMYFQFSYTYMNQDLVLQNEMATANNLQLQFIYQPQINRQVK